MYIDHESFHIYWRYTESGRCSQTLNMHSSLHKIFHTHWPPHMKMYSNMNTDKLCNWIHLWTLIHCVIKDTFINTDTLQLWIYLWTMLTCVVMDTHDI